MFYRSLPAVTNPNVRILKVFGRFLLVLSESSIDRLDEWQDQWNM